jgi:hypothetical protein
MDQPCTHTDNFVGADGCPHATAAERYSAIDCSCGNCPRQRDHVIRVVVSGDGLNRTEVYDLMGSTAQQIRDLFFQNEPSMI